MTVIMKVVLVFVATDIFVVDDANADDNGTCIMFVVVVIDDVNNYDKRSGSFCCY